MHFDICMISACFKHNISSNNKELLAVEGQEFYNENMHNIALNCCKYDNFNCHVSVYTQNGQLIRVGGEHNHNSCNLNAGHLKKVIEIQELIQENLTPAPFAHNTNIN